MYKVKAASGKDELDRIYALRYRMLRAPWGQPYESSFDNLEEKSVNLYIGDEKGHIIACGRLQENAGRVGQIRYMAVDSTSQGKGLGKLIVNALEDAARRLNLERIELQARENAVNFYLGCGYVLKEQTFKLWDVIQHYRMEKMLK
jgi:predicted GNAT family N-acyltransferase